MHLTEVSRFVDSEVGKYITNDSYLGMLETLCRLVIALTVLACSFLSTVYVLLNSVTHLHFVIVG